MCYQLVLWDFNGTLIDDVHAALASVNDMLTKRGMDIITLKQYRSYVDTPIVKFYENIFDLNKISFDVIAAEFSEGYERHLDLCRITPCAVKMLERFRDSGARQIVCSSSERQWVVSLLKHFGLDGYFDLIIGAQDKTAGSKTERAMEYIASAGEGKKALFIGDCLHDYETAQAIGADCVLCCSGHQDRETLERCGAMMCGELDELYDKLFSKEEVNA